MSSELNNNQKSSDNATPSSHCTQGETAPRSEGQPKDQGRPKDEWWPVDEGGTRAVENADPKAETSSRRGSIPVRWASPSNPRSLRKQPTRLTIIDVPTDIKEVDENEEEEDDDDTTWTLSCSRCCVKRCGCGGGGGDGLRFDVVQKRFIAQGVLVRTLLTIHAFFVFYAATVHLHSWVYTCMCLAYAALSVTEGIVMYKMRGFSQKKWICTSTLLYTVSVVPAIWALQFRLLEMRVSDGYGACLLNYGSCLSPEAANETVHSHVTRAFFARNYEDYEGLTTSVQYTLVFVLIGSRWMLPRDNFTREKVVQVLLVLVGSGEDIVEFVNVIFSIGHFGCSRGIVSVVMLLWSISVFQFSIAIPEKKPRVNAMEKPNHAVLNVWVEAVNQLLAKRRESVGDVSLYVARKPLRDLRRTARRRRARYNKALRRYDWVHTTEFREAAISITIQDGPFLVFRLAVLIILGYASMSVFFYALKNLLIITLQIYRVYAILAEVHQRRRSSILPTGSKGNDYDIEDDDDDEDDIENQYSGAESESADEDGEVYEKAYTYTVREGKEEKERPQGMEKLSTVNEKDDRHVEDGNTLKGVLVNDMEKPPVALPSSSETELRTRSLRGEATLK